VVALRRLGEIDRIALALTVVSSVVWLAILGFVALTILRRAWAPLTLRADRDTGAIEFVERNALARRERRQTVPLLQLAGLSVEMIAGRRTRSAPSPMWSILVPNVRITLRIDDGSRRPQVRVLRIHVEGVDRREEVADLAYRLGAASGLAYQRVVRSDPRDIELSDGHAIAIVIGSAPETIPSEFTPE